MASDAVEDNDVVAMMNFVTDEPLGRETDFCIQKMGN